MSKGSSIPDLKIRRTTVKGEILYQGEFYFLKGKKKREMVEEVIVSKKETMRI